ncbi:MAG: hypothetical protein WC602_02160 [archaeon]
MQKETPLLDRDSVGFILAEAVSIIAAAFLFNASGFSFKKAMLFGSMGQTISYVLTWQFILFLIIFPFAFALIAFKARSVEKKALLVRAIIGALIAGIISLAAFPALREYWLFGIFYLIAVYLCIETAKLNFLELKKWVLPRTMMNSMEKATIALGLGVFVSILILAASSQTELVKDLENTIASQAGATPEGIADSSAGILVQANQQVLAQLEASPQYSALRSSSAPEARNFTTFIEEWDLQAKSPEYRDMLKSEIMKNQAGSVFDLVKGRIPFLETLLQWYWLLITVSLASVFFFIASIIFRPLCALYGTVLGAILGKDNQ